MKKITHVKLLVVFAALLLLGLGAVGYTKAMGNNLVAGILPAQGHSNTLSNALKNTRRIKSQLKMIKASYGKIIVKYTTEEERKGILKEFAKVVFESGNLVIKIETLLSQARKDSPTDPNAYLANRQDKINEIQNDYNLLQQKFQNIKDIINQLKGAEKDLTKKILELDDYLAPQASDTYLALYNLSEQIKSNLGTAWVNIVVNPAVAHDKLEQINGLKKSWTDAVNRYKELTAPPPLAPTSPPPPSNGGDTSMPRNGIFLQGK